MLRGPYGYVRICTDLVHAPALGADVPLTLAAKLSHFVLWGKRGEIEGNGGKVGNKRGRGKGWWK